jgi:hypothetical protein
VIGPTAGNLFSYVDLEKRIGVDQPLRAIRAVRDTAQARRSGNFAPLQRRELMQFDRKRRAVAAANGDMRVP